MRGTPGTPIKLTIVRPGRDKPFDVAMVRERIELRPVKWEIKDGIGIININTFSAQTGDDPRGAAGDRQGDRRQAARLCRRPALQPRRPARPGDRGQRRLPRAAARSCPSAAASKRHRALLCQARRPGAGPAGDRAGRCRHRPRRPRSSPARCRITAARSSWASAASARARSRPWSRPARSRRCA